MGYYIDITSAEWVIKETPEALAALREMPKKYKAIQRGGSSNGEKWFSWMNDTDIENAETVQAVFNQLGFETHDVDGGFEIMGYSSKTGQEDLFLAVLAPWTEDGSYIEWQGEDREQWRHEIRDGKMFVLQAEIRWTGPIPYEYVHYELDPRTMKGSVVTFDITDEADTAKKLAEAEAAHVEHQAYWAERRAENEAKKQESISLA